MRKLETNQLFSRVGAEVKHERNSKTSAADRVVIEAFAKLDRTALGLAVGTLSGLGVFTATVCLLLKEDR